MYPTMSYNFKITCITTMYPGNVSDNVSDNMYYNMKFLELHVSIQVIKHSQILSPTLFKFLTLTLSTPVTLTLTP